MNYTAVKYIPNTLKMSTQGKKAQNANGQIVFASLL